MRVRGAGGAVSSMDGRRLRCRGKDVGGCGGVGTRGVAGASSMRTSEVRMFGQAIVPAGGAAGNGAKVVDASSGWVGRSLEARRSRSQTSASEVWEKSAYHWPTASRSIGVDRQTTSLPSCCELRTNREGGDWHGDDCSCRTPLPQRGDGRAHGGAGRQAVVDQDHGLSGHIHWRAIAAVGSLAALQFGVLAGGNGFDGLGRDAQALDDVGGRAT